jgi:hypothetical protein
VIPGGQTPINLNRTLDHNHFQSDLMNPETVSTAIEAGKLKAKTLFTEEVCGTNTPPTTAERASNIKPITPNKLIEIVLAVKATLFVRAMTKAKDIPILMPTISAKTSSLEAAPSSENLQVPGTTMPEDQLEAMPTIPPPGNAPAVAPNLTHTLPQGKTLSPLLRKKAITSVAAPRAVREIMNANAVGTKPTETLSQKKKIYR